MAYFKVRATKTEDGGYSLSYGKGKKKLTASVVRLDENAGWRCYDSDGNRHPGVPGHQPFDKLKDLKAAWGEWAAAVYNEEGAAVATPPADSSPAPPPPPPPVITPKGSPPPPAPTITPTTPVEEPEPITGLIGPNAIIEDVFHWMLRNEHRVVHHPTKYLIPPWDSVARHYLMLNPDSPHRDTFKLAVPVETFDVESQPANTPAAPAVPAAPAAPAPVNRPVPGIGDDCVNDNLHNALANRPTAGIPEDDIPF